MALQKQSVPINFSQGLDTKSDPFQVAPGKFLSLENTVFNKIGQLTKRNGYAQLTSLPDSSSTFLTTFNGNLTAIGNSLNAYSQATSSWVSKGNVHQAQLDVLPTLRNNTNQSQADTVVASNGLACTVYTDNIPSGGTTSPAYKYIITDSTTGQNIVAPTLLAGTAGTVVDSPRVFLLGNYFVILFSVNITITHHIQYIAINTGIPTAITGPIDVSSAYTPATTPAFDGVVANNNLYFAWRGNDGGGAIRYNYLDSHLNIHTTKVLASHTGDIFTLAADISGPTPIIYITFYDTGTQAGYTFAIDHISNSVLGATQVITSEASTNLASVANNGACQIYYQVTNAYSYDAGIRSDYINHKQITQAGTITTPGVVARSLGLASKAFTVGSTNYMLGIYSAPSSDATYQPTYFLIDDAGHVVAKLAYSNAGSYYTTGLPSVTVNNGIAQVAYLIKDLIQAVNKTQGVANTVGVYSQTGINLAKFTLTDTVTVSSEIGSNLHLSGGFLWMYDGFMPVEHGFFLWPDSVEVSTSTTGGSLVAQKYFYQVTYEWNDNQGNTFRSAPSIPVSITTTGSTSSNTIDIPTLRLTYKITSPIRVVIYRWSTAQQTYYEITSLSAPLLNDPTVDSVEFVDTLADSSILGNTILYTTGGVIENIAAPAVSTMTLWQSRLFLIDSEDKNLLWFSKQVIENTPVELSDLLTIYVAPTTGAQESTGPSLALSPMDDKLIVFKRDAIYYISGQGPDNTGANNQYSDPVFITSTVGCSNQNSIVFIPQGLMFQSDKGIWLLGRDLSTTYIGAPVEAFNDFTVRSAINVPGTNQVRFTLDNGTTLMYDYFYGQWGTFTNIPSVSSTLYQNLHTYINSFGLVYQESPGIYLDGSNPVSMSFTTSWFNMMGLQGYERAYFFYLLGVYKSPHKLAISIAYDYSPAPTQLSIISPDNYSIPYGNQTLYGGGSPYGGEPALEQWRVFLQQQKCESFQISLKEQFDSSFSTTPGAGLTLSGINLIIGGKSGYPRLRASKSVG